MKDGIRGGHNFQAVGASALADETTEDRKVKDAAIKYLKIAGDTVIDCTPGNCDKNTDLAYGTNTANNNHVDLFVPIHFNKAYASYVGAIGSEVWLNPNNAKGVAIGNRILANLHALGFKNRGCKDGMHLHDIKESNMTAVLVEVCFVEATEDVALYKSLGADRVGKAIAEGIVGHVINEPVPQPTPQPVATKVYKTVVADGGLRVRSGPSTSYAILGKLANGTKVRIGSANNGWTNIYFGDHGGYVSSQYLK